MPRPYSVTPHVDYPNPVLSKQFIYKSEKEAPNFILKWLNWYKSIANKMVQWLCPALIHHNINSFSYPLLYCIYLRWKIHILRCYLKIYFLYVVLVFVSYSINRKETTATPDPISLSDWSENPWLKTKTPCKLRCSWLCYAAKASK